MEPIEDKQVTLLEKFINLVDKYGLFRIFKALCVFLSFAIILYTASHMDKIIDKVVQIQEERHRNEHSAALEFRLKIKPQVDNVLKSSLDDLKADRAFIVEMHNGNSNSSGLPFLYGEMTYETAREGVDDIDNQYTNVNLSRIPLSLYLENNKFWLGSCDDLAKIDKKLAARCFSNDMQYLAICTIYGTNNEIGYYGVSYTSTSIKNKPTKEAILKSLLISSQKLSTLLDLRQAVMIK